MDLFIRCLHARSISSVPIVEYRKEIRDYGKRICKKKRKKRYYHFYVENQNGRKRLNKTFPYFPYDYLIRAKIRENTYHFNNEWAGKPVK